jgi:hypothetical protein
MFNGHLKPRYEEVTIVDKCNLGLPVISDLGCSIHQFSTELVNGSTSYRDLEYNSHYSTKLAALNSMVYRLANVPMSSIAEYYFN